MDKSLRKHFPYGKKELKNVPKGARISVITVGSETITGCFDSVGAESLTLSYGQGMIKKQYHLADVRSFALI